MKKYSSNILILTFVYILAIGCSSQNKATSPKVDPCTQNVKLTDGKSVSQRLGALEGTPYHYETWVDEGGAHGVTFKWYGANQGGGAAYRASWTNPDCFLARTGYFWGDGQEYTAYKNIYADFNYTRSGRGTAGGWSYIGIYGWSRNPDASDPNERLIEYYIVDDWFGNESYPDTIPPGIKITVGTIIDTITVDGAMYDIHKSLRVQKPSIDDTQTFTQIFSIRRTLRKCGTISVTEHFKKWEELGLKLGNLYEAKFLVEAGSGTGWIDFSYLSFSQEDKPRNK